jgi:hypothetical protein
MYGSKWDVFSLALDIPKNIGVAMLAIQGKNMGKQEWK